ncbi:MAG: hypothetical protein HFJ06_05425 [Lachnospiraceae bacterium]|nr:hypothetical protein [Lachnospiraceae bacterium]
MGTNKKKSKKTNLREKESSLKKERMALEKRGKRKKLLISVVFAVAGITIAAAVLWKISGAGTVPSQKSVFRIGGEEVFLDEVNLCILQNVMNIGITDNMLNTTSQDGSSMDDFYKDKILQVITDYKVEAKIAEQQGITLSEKDRDAIRVDAVEYMGTVDGRILKQLGITQERVIEIYTQRYLAHALEESVIKDLKVEEQKYCTMYMLLFPKVETDANGDYVREDDGETPVMLSEEDIKKKKEDCEKAYEELKDGADIEEIAVKYGVSNVSGEESNLAESFEKPFSEYAVKLKEGEYSPILETASCYGILKMITENNEEIAEQIMGYYKSDLEQETIDENKTKWYEEAGAGSGADFVGSTWENISLYDFVKYVEE